MKKILSIFVLQIFVFGCIFGVTINSKVGYEKLAWGSSVADAQKAGYKMTRMTASSDRAYLAKLYNVAVEGYSVISKDRNVKALQFHYYNGQLFHVTEMLNFSDFTPQQLETRYGSFAQQGILKVGKQYMDAKIENGGAVSYLSIMISNSAGAISTMMYDWDVYKRISYTGQKLAKKEKKTIPEQLASLATKLVQENFYKTKPSFAITAFPTDNKNILVEDYIRNALTEAVFKIGKVKIIERANIDAVLKELNFQESGLVNEQTAKSVGMLVGADFVCFGDLKDVGDKIVVTAKVVDVETGEICAISSDLIEKDDYLKNQLQTIPVAKQTPKSSTEKTPTAKTYTAKIPTTKATSPAVSSANNAWKVTRYRNDFDGYSQYIFRSYSVDDKFVFVSYKKCDIKSNSRVIAGVGGWTWDYFDIKSKEGTVTKYFDDTWKEYLDASQKESFKFVWNHSEGSRFLTERFINNDYVSLRRKYDGLIRKFQTAGLLDKMAEYGITWEEIDAAIANEEF